MTLYRWIVPLGIAVLFVAAWQAMRWPGVLAVGGGVVMWLLLHVTRLVRVLQRAARQPVGTVASAVMLNARLRAGQSLMHVVALARALGELRTPQQVQPECYRWTDASQSWVECEFRGGRLLRWQLHRP
jgi:hypothetical protein